MQKIKITVTVLLTICLMMTFAILTSCGENDNEEHAGPQPSTIKIVSNADNTGHVHEIEFTLNDFSNPPAAGASYTSTVADGHSHNVTLTNSQLTEVYGGQDMDVTSSVAGSPPHSHAWTLHSGNILYKQNCEKCHGSGKLGTPASQISGAIAANRGGMGSLSFLTPAQIQAISTANSL